MPDGISSEISRTIVDSAPSKEIVSVVIALMFASLLGLPSNVTDDGVTVYF